jgi:hypothetical protein
LTRRPGATLPSGPRAVPSSRPPPHGARVLDLRPRSRRGDPRAAPALPHRPFLPAPYPRNSFAPGPFLFPHDARPPLIAPGGGAYSLMRGRTARGPVGTSERLFRRPDS